MKYRDAKKLKRGDVVYLSGCDDELHYIMDNPKEFTHPFNFAYGGFAKKRLVFMVLKSNGSVKYVDHLEVLKDDDEELESHTKVFKDFLKKEKENASS